VTPVYYMNMSAQLKLVIDRFYAFGEKLKGKKTVLITASASENITGILVENYKAIDSYLGLEDRGMVLGEGCPVPPVTAGSPFVGKAYEFGKSL
ncbi:MAG: NAD(P)H-dependent oxidoreductase, partial [Eubacterium sp.]|nr:NAD(P)H-dependent oxidoreductase [Eubacterium sp.]